VFILECFRASDYICIQEVNESSWLAVLRIIQECH